jgi:hypothetical protein
MSINIGFKNNSYSSDKFSQGDKLVLNSYNNSNVIILNTDDNTCDDAIINFHNQYSFGLKDNKFIVNDMINNTNIFELSSKVEFNNDFHIKDLLYTTSNTIVFNSNINVQFKSPTDNIQVFDNNNDAVFSIDANITKINNAKIDNTLYVDRIVNNVGNSIEIVNPNIVGLVLQSIDTETSVNINNVYNQHNNIPSLTINRYNNLKNIVEIGTCNMYTRDINKQFIIDKNGMVSIGSKQPTASLYISQIIKDVPSVFKYEGNSVGDVFNITPQASVGIGTQNVKGLLHIQRNDDLKDELTRTVPLLRLDMQYDISCNISYTCNIKDILNKTYQTGLLSSSCIVNADVSVNTSNFLNNFYIMNHQMKSNINSLLYNTCNFNLNYVPNINSLNTISGINNVYNSFNIIYYPSSLYAYEKTNEFSYTTKNSFSSFYHSLNSSNTSNFFTSHILNYSIILMSKDTYEYSGYVPDITNPKYNANKFSFASLYYSNLNATFYTIGKPAINTSSNIINNVHYNLNILIEDIDHNIFYKYPMAAKIYEQPYFFYITSNQSFKSSLSSYGTLSLGSPDISNIHYQPDKYVLYADGLSYIKNAEMNEIYSSNNYISFKNNNFSNIYNITAQSISTDKANFNTTNVSNLNVFNQYCSNIYTSNIRIIKLNGDYLNMTPDKFHLSTYFYVSSNANNSIIDNSTLVKFVVDDKLSTGNSLFKNCKGLSITNEKNNIGLTQFNKIHPSISIIGYDGSIPYVNIANGNTDYFFRIINKQFNIDNTDIFQICCDNITYDTNRFNYFNNKLSQASFINHIKSYNVLTFGELNNVCIKCTNNLSTQSTENILATTFTNGNNKIALGFPYGLVSGKGYSIDNWPQYFNNYMINNTDTGNQYIPYMLNVFGNMGVFTISGKKMMTIEADNGTTFTHIDNEVITMKVNGTLNAIDVNQTSDSNIKTDLRIIENALDKIKTINGYMYTNLLTSNSCSGLIAQEVQQILPEVVQKNNDLLSISYGNMLGLIIEGIKELNVKLDDISKRIKD